MHIKIRLIHFFYVSDHCNILFLINDTLYNLFHMDPLFFVTKYGIFVVGSLQFYFFVISGSHDFARKIKILHFLQDPYSLRFFTNIGQTGKIG